MTTATPRRPIVQMMSLDEVRAELAELVRGLRGRGMTLAEFKERGDSWKLEARDRGVLARIRNLEFLARSGEGE